MVNRPKAIGTAGETAVVRYLNSNGFGGAERLALHGTLDEGDATVCPGVGAEVKAGKAAENASDAQIAAWLTETETERVNRRADVMLLVLKRKGKGVANAGQWWAFLPGWAFVWLAHDGDRWHIGGKSADVDDLALLPSVRITLAEATQLLRRAGYGDPIERTAS